MLKLHRIDFGYDNKKCESTYTVTDVFVNLNRIDFFYRSDAYPTEVIKEFNSSKMTGTSTKIVIGDTSFTVLESVEYLHKKCDDLYI